MSSKETTDDATDFVPIEDSSLHVTEEARRHALERCREYRAAIEDYLEAKPGIPWHGASFNVGRVAGGMASNTFPKRAAIEFDVRYLEHDDRQWVEEQVARIAAESAVEGSRGSWEWTSERPIWPEQHTAEQAGLLEALRGAAEALGHPFCTEIRWGTSDANLIAIHGVPTVDGLGPVGFEDHSEREHIVLRSLVERVQLAALALAALPA